MGTNWLCLLAFILAFHHCIYHHYISITSYVACFVFAQCLYASAYVVIVEESRCQQACNNRLLSVFCTGNYQAYSRVNLQNFLWQSTYQSQILRVPAHYCNLCMLRRARVYHHCDIHVRPPSSPFSDGLFARRVLDLRSIWEWFPQNASR